MEKKYDEVRIIDVNCLYGENHAHTLVFKDKFDEIENLITPMFCTSYTLICYYLNGKKVDCITNTTSTFEFHKKLGGEYKDFSVKSKVVDNKKTNNLGIIGRIKKMLGLN